jgi:hypothetical protein
MAHLITEGLQKAGEYGQNILQAINPSISSQRSSSKILLKMQLALNTALLALNTALNDLKMTPSEPVAASSSVGKQTSIFRFKKKKVLEAISKESQEGLACQETLQKLSESIVKFRTEQQAAATLPVTKWIQQVIDDEFRLIDVEPSSSSSSSSLSASRLPHQVLPLVFEGVWDGASAPEGIKVPLWPPKLWKCYSWSELNRSFLGGSNVFQRESMTLEGKPPIQITDLFARGEDGLIRVPPDTFFVETIAAINDQRLDQFFSRRSESQRTCGEIEGIGRTTNHFF